MLTSWVVRSTLEFSTAPDCSCPNWPTDGSPRIGAPDWKVCRYSPAPSGSRPCRLRKSASATMPPVLRVWPLEYVVVITPVGSMDRPVNEPDVYPSCVRLETEKLLPNWVAFDKSKVGVMLPGVALALALVIVLVAIALTMSSCEGSTPLFFHKISHSLIIWPVAMAMLGLKSCAHTVVLIGIGYGGIGALTILGSMEWILVYHFLAFLLSFGLLFWELFFVSGWNLNLLYVVLPTGVSFAWLIWSAIQEGIHDTFGELPLPTLVQPLPTPSAPPASGSMLRLPVGTSPPPPPQSNVPAPATIGAAMRYPEEGFRFAGNVSRLKVM